MTTGDLWILKFDDVCTLLEGRELELIQTVQAAYEAHAQGASSLPQSTFLRFHDEPQNRIIALPAYLGQQFEMAGVKWIASFPGNHEHGLARASAIIILNSLLTGRPEAILEASFISAKRTAASAALAARSLHQDRPTNIIGFIGCGLINAEVARFLLAVFPLVEKFVVFDTHYHQAQAFADICRSLHERVQVEVMAHTDDVLKNATLISLATTALEPHIDDLSACADGSTILHVSLRDLSPDVILACDNVVDDVDHVCRAQTSVHLAEQRVHDRAFIRCTLADITRGVVPARLDAKSITVFSPFGLGVLDIAVGKFTLDLALSNERGTLISGFLPQS